MDVAVFQTASLNNVLTRMGASLVKALQQQGVDAAAYAFGPGETKADVVRALEAARTRVVISFASACADWCDPSGVSVYDRLDCAFVGWDVDHPSYNPARFTTPIARRGQICASGAHLAFAAALGRQTTARLMLPGVDAVDQAPLPIADRPIYGLAAMSWIGEPEVWWAEFKGTPAYALIEGAVARVLADPEANLFAAFQAAAADMGLELPLDDAFCQMIARTGLFIRQYDRWRLGQMLATADVPCAICGDGWRERLGERSNLLFADSLDVDGLARLYGRARVVFNANGANGASERVVQATAAGAMVATDFSTLLETSFSSHGAAGLYDRRTLGGVHEALALPSDAQQAVANRGRDLVAANHLWSHKAAAVIDMLGEGLLETSL